MTTNKIFLSYSRSDTTAAIKIATQLRSAGADIWIDRLDISPGNIWDLEIEKALEACGCLLFISSKASVASENVLNEIYYALEEKKRIVPVKIDDCKIPFRIKRLQHVDLSANYEEGFKYLLVALKLDQKYTDSQQSSVLKEDRRNSSNSQAEEDLWNKAKQYDSIESYQNYIKTFPSGRCVDRALAAIKKLEVVSEDHLWNKTKLNNTIYSFQNYIKESRLKNYTDEANKKLIELGKSGQNQQEDEYWRKARTINTTSSYQDYLKTFENGVFKGQALHEIKRLGHNSKEMASHSISSSANSLKSRNNKFGKSKKLLMIYLGAGVLVVIVTIYLFTTTNKDSSFAARQQAKTGETNVGADNSSSPVSLEEVRSLANSGDADAMYKLGIIYKDGDGVRKDITVAKEWLAKAAEADNVEAMVALGYIFFSGDKTVGNYKATAFDYFRRAAGLNNKEAIKKVADMYYYGDGVNESQIESRRWLDKLDSINASNKK